MSAAAFDTEELRTLIEARETKKDILWECLSVAGEYDDDSGDTYMALHRPQASK